MTAGQSGRGAAQKALLGVEHSASGRRWRARGGAAAENAALHMAQKYGMASALAEVLARRGVAAAQAPAFLSPSLKTLMPEPYTMHNMEAAARRLAQACIKGEKVAVLADYDVDGACSAALLQRFLAALGLPCRLYIPDRAREGYGPNEAAMRKLAGEGAKLIITADCGANASAALQAGHEAGADILALDHHAPAPLKPGEFSGYLQVNPNQPQDSSGLGYLCAAGVVYMCLAATARLLRARAPEKAKRLPDLLSLLDLTALATVCDVVPLIGLNRAFVAKGLAVARRQGNLGLAVLAQAAGINEPLNAYHCGYILGPRLNAGGRIGDSALGAKLLTAVAEAEAARLAQQLCSLNYGRQQLEAEQLAEAQSAAEADLAADAASPLVFAQSAGWHLGVAGLLAARLRERFAKPAFVLTQTAGGAQATGSARAQEGDGVNLGALIRRAEAEGLLLKGGGHAQAAGFTLRAEMSGAFKAWLEAELGKNAAAAGAAGRRETLLADGVLSARGASAELIAELERAGPYGAGNPQPVFAFPRHRIAYARVMGQTGAHLRVTLEDGQGGRLNAAAFRAADTALGRFLLGAQGGQAHILGSLSLNCWNGQTSPQLHIIDAAEVR